MTQVIGYQGIPGAFSEIAGLEYFGRDNEFRGYRSFPEVFQALEGGELEYGVIPIENSLAGSVGENYDLLYKKDVHIVGEYYMRINHHLLALSREGVSNAERLGEIESVVSHYKALEQCLGLFEANPRLRREEFSDTAGSAKYVAESGDMEVAAIASIEAAKRYGLEVIKANIEDDPENWTRFVFVAPGHSTQCETPESDTYKYSLAFQLPNKSGSLYEALKVFAESGMNLMKIESRPIVGDPFNYIFYLDVEFARDEEEVVQHTLHKFEEVTKDIKKLGCYKREKTT